MDYSWFRPSVPRTPRFLRTTNFWSGSSASSADTPLYGRIHAIQPVKLPQLIGIYASPMDCFGYGGGVGWCEGHRLHRSWDGQTLDFFSRLAKEIIGTVDGLACVWNTDIDP